jgi:hypothetical protein
MRPNTASYRSAISSAKPASSDSKSSKLQRLKSGSFWRAPDAPFGSSLVGETGVEHVDSGMLRDAAFGKQNRGQNGAFLPDGERGSGLGDRSHGGEFPN